MADEIVLIHHGKVVLHGGLEHVRQSFGRNTLRLEYEGDGAFLAHLPQVREANVVTNAAELTLADGADPQHVLEAAMGKLRIRRYELYGRRSSQRSIFGRTSLRP